MKAARPFEAIQDYNQAILIQPDYWEAIYNRANAYEVTKQYPKSLRDIEFLLNEFPDSITFEFFKGLVYTQMDSLKKAADTFEKVWNQDGTNIEALINWATVLYYQTDYQAAIKLLEEAVEIDPSQANAFNTMNQLFQRGTSLLTNQCDVNKTNMRDIASNFDNCQAQVKLLCTQMSSKGSILVFENVIEHVELVKDTSAWMKLASQSGNNMNNPCNSDLDDLFNDGGSNGGSNSQGGNG